MASTIVRMIWTLPDGTEAFGPAFTIHQDMKTLGDSKFRMELYVDKPPAVSIAPEDIDVDTYWGAGPMENGHQP